MNIGSICTRRVITAHPQLDVQAAAELMRQEHVGFLVVVPEEPRGPQPPLGVITDPSTTCSSSWPAKWRAFPARSATGVRSRVLREPEAFGAAPAYV